MLALLPDGAEKPSPDQLAAVNALFLKGKDTEALAAVLRGFAGLEVIDAELKAVRVPVQFVYGSREVKFLTDGIEGAKKEIPKAGVVVVDQGTHIDTFTTPEFRKAVVGFLKANKE